MNTLRAKPTFDKVYVKNLVLPCRIGVYEEERKEKQNIVLDIEIFVDLTGAACSDDVQKTISYSEVQEQVTEFVAGTEFKLLETLAENIAALILKNPAVNHVTVGVKKEKYAKQPIMGIEITRDRLG